MKATIFLSMLLCFLAGCEVKVKPSANPVAEPKQAAEARSAAIPHSDADQAALIEAARSVVRSMDRAEYAQVWEGGGDALKRITPKGTFVTFMSALRGSLGQPESRGNARYEFSRKIDDALPEGDYAWLEVETTFHGKKVTERMCFGQEGKGWKLLGYFIEAKTKIKLFG